MRAFTTMNLRPTPFGRTYPATGAAGLIICLAMIGSLGCAGEQPAGPQQASAYQSTVAIISGQAELEQTIRSAGDRLLLFDLYADWCSPCRILSPLLEEISAEHRDRVDVFKIDVDSDPDIARAFGATGIPHVVFVRNGEVVHALSGLRSKDTYVRAIRRLAASGELAEADTPDGTLVDGVRRVVMSAATLPGSVLVHRGDTVQLVIEKLDFPYSVHIPAFGISADAVPGQDLEVVFKARDVGVFPFFCNGDCPAGDGARHGDIVVMPYAGSKQASYRELDAAAAQRFIVSSKPVILDVRTPAEFYDGHIVGARLIPVQQLAARLGELDGLEQRQMLVYCRSGNRSTVAAKILIDNGFERVSNLRAGLIDWVRSGRQVVR